MKQISATAALLAQALARTLGLEVPTLEIRVAEDVSSALEAPKSRADALYICPDPLTNTHRVRINTLALSEAAMAWRWRLSLSLSVPTFAALDVRM